MWHLLETYRYELLADDITNEVLIGLFWEESTFKNIREMDPNGNNAVGFGQVNTRELWRLIPSLKLQGKCDPESGELVSRNEHVANIMLADNGDCVALTTQMMVEFGNRRGKVLSGWANGATSIVAKWAACEKKLDIEDPYSDDWVKETRYGHVIPRRAIVTEALNLARSGASLDVVGCVPEW
jgi:hypothetical protein